MKKTMTLGAAIAAVLMSGSVLADASVNAGATTDYLWRGVTQSGDTASVFGGADYSHSSGLYGGVWLGSLIDGTEMDVYGGFAGEAGGFGYDIGVISYQYSLSPNINFTEAYVTGSYSIISVGVYTTIDAGKANENGAFDKGDLYVNASADFDIGPIATSVFAGHYSFDNDNKFGNGDLDYSHYGISFTSGEVTVSVEKNDQDGTCGLVFGLTGDPADGSNCGATRVVATWSKSWDI